MHNKVLTSKQIAEYKSVSYNIKSDVIFVVCRAYVRAVEGRAGNKCICIHLNVEYNRRTIVSDSCHLDSLKAGRLPTKMAPSSPKTLT